MSSNIVARGRDPVYKITQYTKDRAKEIGVQVKPSTKKNKKIDVLKDGKYIHSIGDIHYKDYPTYLKQDGKQVADERRRLYHLRHTGKGVGEKLALRLLW